MLQFDVMFRQRAFVWWWENSAKLFPCFENSQEFQPPLFWGMCLRVWRRVSSPRLGMILLPWSWTISKNTFSICNILKLCLQIIKTSRSKKKLEDISISSGLRNRLFGRMMARKWPHTILIWRSKVISLKRPWPHVPSKIGWGKLTMHLQYHVSGR